MAEHRIELGDVVTFAWSDFRWLVRGMDFSTRDWCASLEMQEERAAIMQATVSIRTMELMWDVAKRLIEENERKEAGDD